MHYNYADMGLELQLMFTSTIRMGKKCDLSEFDLGMIVGGRQGGFSISQTADLLGFPCTAVSRVCREWCEKQKHPVSSRSAGRNALLMREARLVKADRKVTPITTHYDSGMRKSAEATAAED